MTKHGLGALEAAKRAMTEIAGALISIVLVLVAVFLPVAFLGGVTGTLYQQFAITIAISVVISGVMALTLSPALAAIIIKAHHGEKKGFFRWFENGFNRLTSGYVGGVARLIQGWPIALLVFARDHRRHRGDVPHPAGQLRAGRGPGLLLHRRRGAGHREPELRRRADREDREDPRRRAGGAGRGDGERLQPRRRHVPQQRRGLLPVDEAVRGAHRPVAAHLQRAAAAEPAVRAAQGGVRLRDQPAVDPGPRHHRRLRVLHPEPRRGRHARHQPGGAGLSSRPRASGPSSPASTPPSAARRSSSSSTSTATRPKCSACRCRTRSRRCRASSARRSPGSSASSAACGGWCCRPTRATASIPDDFSKVFVRSKTRQHGAAVGADHGALRGRAQADGALQRFPGGEDHRQPGAGLQLGPGAGGDGGGGARDASRRLLLRVGRARRCRRSRPAAPRRSPSSPA